jgi:hypothetical protein
MQIQVFALRESIMRFGERLKFRTDQSLHSGLNDLNVLLTYEIEKNKY